jgi:hypothetical protein
VRPSHATDTRLLIAGVVASLALVGYLAVAFANTHASGSNPFAPWIPKYHSTLAVVPRREGGGIAVRASPGWVGAYGVVVPTLVSQPSPGRVEVSLRLRGPGDGPITVVVDEFSSGPDIINTTVPATSKWHHYTFSARVKGRWLGLGMFVGRNTNGRANRRFAARGLTVSLSRH